jgi:tripartite-type tricarboxylate transporter receptor subunit TctC
MATGRRHGRTALWTALVAGPALFATSCASGEAGGEASPGEAAASADSCYAGETATFVVSFGAGSGYDQIARLIAPYLEKELGATVVVENQPGAGGLLALNQLANAQPDGLRFGFFTGQGMVGATLGGADGVNFDIRDLSYVGRTAADDRILMTGGKSELETIEDVMAGSDLSYGSSGPGANDYIDATVLMRLLDIDAEILTGFQKAAEVALAVTAGDVDLFSGTLGSNLAGMKSGDHKALLVIGSEPVAELPDVPALTDLGLDDDELAIARAHIDVQKMGRMIWAPPMMPEPCLTELTDAMEDVMENSEFIADMKKMDQPVDWIPGSEMKEVVEGLLDDSPEEFMELMESAYVE